MRRPGLRALMAVVGASVFVVYAAVAYVGYVLLRTLWAARPSPAVSALLVALLTLVVGLYSYRVGTRQLLARLDAAVLPRDRAPRFHARLDDLVGRMDLEAPTVFVSRLGVPNALSLGGASSGVVVLDVSLFEVLDGDELLAVVAHELAHIESRDSLVQTMAYAATETVVTAVLVVLSPALFLATGAARAWAWTTGRPTSFDNPAARLRDAVATVALLSLFAMTLLVRAHSRRREFAADDRAAEVTGNPFALARALREIDGVTESVAVLRSPLSVRGDEEGWLSRVLSTHPPMDDRVARLVERGRRSGRRVPVE